MILWLITLTRLQLRATFVNCAFQYTFSTLCTKNCAFQYTFCVEMYYFVYLYLKKIQGFYHRRQKEFPSVLWSKGKALCSPLTNFVKDDVFWGKGDLIAEFQMFSLCAAYLQSSSYGFTCLVSCWNHRTKLSFESCLLYIYIYNILNHSIYITISIPTFMLQWTTLESRSIFGNMVTQYWWPKCVYDKHSHFSHVRKDVSQVELCLPNWGLDNWKVKWGVTRGEKAIPPLRDMDKLEK